MNQEIQKSTNAWRQHSQVTGLRIHHHDLPNAAAQCWIHVEQEIVTVLTGCEINKTIMELHGAC